MLQPGSVVVGKWTGQRLTIEKGLGRGANGEVYLVRGPLGLAALKLSDRAQDIALEWGVLNAIKTSPLFPKAIFMDDDASGRKLYFYVMEWVTGQSLDLVMDGLSEPSLYELMGQVLLGLNQLHQTGYAFCDMKAQNILVSLRPAIQVRFVDAGGVTQFGRSVRQFTPFSDRAFWGLGSRKAEASYDLTAFACTFLCVFAAPPADIGAWSVDQRRAWLNHALSKFPHKSYVPLLEDLLNGRLTGAKMALAGLQDAHQNSLGMDIPRRKLDWTEWLMWGSLGTASTVACFALGTLLGWFGK